MRRLLNMMRREKRLRLLFCGLLSLLCFGMALLIGLWAYPAYGPAHGIHVIETLADAETAADSRMWGMGLTVPETWDSLGDCEIASNGVTETYHAVLFRKADYAVLLMSRREITAGENRTVGVDHLAEQEMLLARYRNQAPDMQLFIFYDTAPNYWVYAGLFAGLGGLCSLIYLHFHGRKYLLHHTRFGEEILALEEPLEALREMGREMKKTIMKTANMALLAHWVLYKRYEEEEKKWHYCPIEKSRVISDTLSSLDENADDDEDSGESGYQWTLNELTRQHRILLNSLQEAQTAEAYFHHTGEA